MIVYVDVLFAVNMLMDMTIIWAAGMLLKEQIKIIRIILGAAAGALMYIITLYRPYVNGFVQFLVIIFSMSLSLIIAYSPRNLISLIKMVVTSTAVSFAAAGMIFAFVCLRMFYTKGAAAYIMDNFSYKLLILSSLAVYIIIKFGGKYIRKSAADPKEYFEIAVKLNGKEASLRALADTGNSLKDNIGGNEIIIADYDAVSNIIPYDLSGDGVAMFNMLSETELKTRIRLIPFKSLGNPNGMLLGIKADSAYIKTKVHREERQNIVIGIYEGRLDASGQFNAIVNYEIIL